MTRVLRGVSSYDFKWDHSPDITSGKIIPMLILQTILLGFFLLISIIYSYQKGYLLSIKLGLKFYDYLIIGLISAFYIAFSSYNWIKAPPYLHGKWQGTYNESINLVFNHPTKIKDLYYYFGLSNGSFIVKTQDINNNIESYPAITTDLISRPIFNWHEIEFKPDQKPLTKISLIVESPLIEFWSLALFDNKQHSLINFKVQANYHPGIDNFNHFIITPNKSELDPNIKTGVIYDEVYYAVSAYQYIQKIMPFATTHPPLGSLLISLGILLFGMNPLGFRFIPFLAGVLGLALVYTLAKLIFNSKRYALLSSIFLALDFMHFTINRYALIDAPLMPLILINYILLWLYIANAAKPKNSLGLLYLISFNLGLALAIKWSAVFCLLSLLPFIIFYEHKLALLRSQKVLNYGLLILIPIVLYLLSYVPLAFIMQANNLFAFVAQEQVKMWDFQTSYAVTHHHLYESSWWTWPLVLIPQKLYSWMDIARLKSLSLVLMGNPLLWWGGIYAFLIIGFRFLFKEHNLKYGFILLAIISQYLPYALFTRVCFIYYFYLVTPFWFLLLSALLERGFKRPELSLKIIIIMYPFQNLR